LHYFGEDFEEGNCNKMCDNCAHPKEKRDATKETVQALQTIIETKENHVLQHIVNIMIGKKSNEISSFKHDKLEIFGVGKEKDEYFWSGIVRNAILQDLIKKDIEHYGLLKITEKGKHFIEHPTQIMVAADHNFDNEHEEIEPIQSNRGVTDPKLLKMLEDLRKQVAKAHNLPPYIIFQDISMEEMATRYPITEEEFTSITGVSKGKYTRYGKKFAETIKAYVESNDILRPEDIVVKSVVKKSTNKVKIIQCIDQKLGVDDICRNLNLKRNELIDEIESIVHSGTKVNIDYYLNEIMDEYLLQDIYEYFKTTASESLDDAFKEFKDDEVSIEDIQLVRIKFMSDMAN